LTGFITAYIAEFGCWITSGWYRSSRYSNM